MSWELEQREYAERKQESEDAAAICLLGIAAILAWIAISEIVEGLTVAITMVLKVLFP